MCLSIGLNSKPQEWRSVDGAVFVDRFFVDRFIDGPADFESTGFAIKEIRLQAVQVPHRSPCVSPRGLVQGFRQLPKRESLPWTW